jgi:hypothetical protein
MEMVCFRTRKQKGMTIVLERILKRWRQALREYQNATNDLGYGWYYTEKTNFGFFLWACAQLGVYFLPEFSEVRRKRGKPSNLGRPDCWILLDPERWIDAYFEVKKDHGCIDTGPRRTVLAQLKSAEKQLKELSDSKTAKARIAICFVTLWRNVQSKTVASYESSLSKYVKQLEDCHKIDFYAAYLSPEKLVRAACRENKDTVCYPAIVMVGKFV